MSNTLRKLFQVWREDWAWLKRTVVHKWFVFWECCKLGIPMAGITHDLSKLGPVEWGARATYFHDWDGSRKEDDVSSLEVCFQRMHLHHIHSNIHHWQAWVIVDRGGKLTPVELPDRYRKEMLADWRATGRSRGAVSVNEWYRSNKDKIILHPRTREWIEANLLREPCDRSSSDSS